MSNVAPVRAVLVMMCTASAATSAGPTTRPMGSVMRSWLRRFSSGWLSTSADMIHSSFCSQPVSNRVVAASHRQHHAELRLAAHHARVRLGNVIQRIGFDHGAHARHYTEMQSVF